MNDRYGISGYLISRIQKKHFIVALLLASIGLFLYDLQTQKEANPEMADGGGAGQDITIVVSIAGMSSAAGALVFSSLSQVSQNKSHYYQIMKDFEEQYTNLAEIEVQLRDYVSMTFDEISRQPREVIEDVELYRWKFYQFHERLAHLALRGIIPKEIARYYVFSFGTDLFYIDIDFDPKVLKLQLSYTMTWCRIENIKKPHRHNGT